MAEQTESFNENYQIIKNIAETLRNQEDPDIDGLVPMVEKASSAYAICSGRIAAVREALKKILPDEDTE